MQGNKMVVFCQMKMWSFFMLLRWNEIFPVAQKLAVEMNAMFLSHHGACKKIKWRNAFDKLPFALRKIPIKTTFFSHLNLERPFLKLQK